MLSYTGEYKPWRDLNPGSGDYTIDVQINVGPKLTLLKGLKVRSFVVLSLKLSGIVTS